MDELLAAVILFVALLTTGCVHGQAPEEGERVVIEHELRSQGGPTPDPILEGNSSKGSSVGVTLVEAEDGWRTDEGEDLNDRCVRELMELAVERESDESCVGEVDRPPWTPRHLEHRIEDLREERRSLNENDSVAGGSDSNRSVGGKETVKEIDEEIERLQTLRDEITVYDAPVRRYRVEIHRPDHPDIVLETDEKAHGGDYRWKASAGPQSGEIFYMPRLDLVVRRLFYRGAASDR